MIKKTLIIIKPAFKKLKSYKFITILLLVMLIIVTSMYLRERGKIRNIANAEIEVIVNMVGQLIILPEDLKPNIATIENVDKLREKESNFYKNAENGDKLLIYPDQVILYSPERNIIVNMAPIIPDAHIEETENNE